MTDLLDRARAMIAQLSTKEPGFGMAYALTDTRRSCELYGKRAEAAVWLIEHGKEVVAALAALTLPDAVAGERACDLCAGKCRGHGADPESWMPEPGSLAALQEHFAERARELFMENGGKHSANVQTAWELANEFAAAIRKEPL